MEKPPSADSTVSRSSPAAGRRPHAAALRGSLPWGGALTPAPTASSSPPQVTASVSPPRGGFPAILAEKVPLPSRLSESPGGSSERPPPSAMLCICPLSVSCVCCELVTPRGPGPRAHPPPAHGQAHLLNA